MGRLHGRSPNGGGHRAAAATGFVLGMALFLLFSLVRHKESDALADTQLVLPGAKIVPATRCSMRGGGSLFAGSAEAAAGKGLPATVTATQEQVAALPAQLPELDGAPYVFVSFGNAAYFEMVHNWAKSVQLIGAPFIIAGFDDAMLEKCTAAGLPCTRAQFRDSANFRGDFTAFRAMGAVKVRFVLNLLEQHPTLGMVVVSDSDAVWLRQPWPYFQQRPRADFFISTDCLSVQLEEEWKPRHLQPRCGHIPGNSFGRAFNTGVFAARNTPTARAFLRAWADMLTDPEKERHSDPAHRGIDDQMAVNIMFDQGEIIAAGEDDPRGILAWNQTMRVQTLPVALFSNGHVSFVQRTPWKHGYWPMVIHATFQRYPSQGKKERMREFGLWYMDPPEYYGAGTAGAAGGGGTALTAAGAAGGGAAAGGLRFLAYDNGVVQWVAEMERRRYGARGARMPLLEKHWLAMSYQLMAFRDALATAQILGRTLVFPQIWCWCDFDEHPLILESCRIRGTDLQLPFQCPLDFMLPIPALERQAVQYRSAGFLQLPQVSPAVRQSQAALVIAESRPADPFPTATRALGHTAMVWPGIKQGELQRVAQPVELASVLLLRGHVPGYHGGFDTPAANLAFDGSFNKTILEYNELPFWCCFTWGDADREYRRLFYALPPPFAAGWKPWQAHDIRQAWPLEWCDRVSTQHDNRNFTVLPQHPCAFLRNETAAAIAAGDPATAGT